MSVGYQFARPLAYLTVNAPGLGVFRAAFPGAMALAASAAYLLLPIKIDLVGDRSASDLMATFFVTLPGFFIAALAAVSTFQGGDLDEAMPNATMPIRLNGSTKSVPISLRVFLSYLFSYLTVISFFGFFVCGVGALLTPNIVALLGSLDAPRQHPALVAMGSVFVGLLSFVSATVISCTAQGLYFLAERVHQSLTTK